MKKLLIIVEKTETGYSAYSPDIPSCGSTGETKEEVERNIQETIQFHIEGLRAEAAQFRNHPPIPHTSTWPLNRYSQAPTSTRSVEAVRAQMFFA
jgi:predicted RNase H-like HicB family nuclease